MIKQMLLFKKENYTRILTKLLPDEYKEFVSLNILVRDASHIAQFYKEESNLKALYNNLITKKYLKYPGKYELYVDFIIFQKFVMVYRDDLSINLDSHNLEEESNKQNLEQPTSEKLEEVKEEPKETSKETNWTNLLLGRK